MMNRRDAVIQDGTTIVGEIRNGGRVEIRGYVEGRIQAANVVVAPGGQVYGLIKADAAEVHGTMQGDVFIRNLIAIGEQGSVTGNVQYSQLKLEMGGLLSAQLHNVPPQLAGDFNLVVDRGQAVIITPLDLTALDPDDTADHLIYSVVNPQHGAVLLVDQPSEYFTQADLLAGRVSFRHDGSGLTRASFDVVVADASGATSGAPRSVEVAVRGG